MKKIITLTLALLLIFGCISIIAIADEVPLSADIYVTVADKGNLVVTQEKITVTDKDNDGKLNIDEALFALHEAKYTGGAAAGYATQTTQWGLGIVKLWGDESGNYGYYVNNASAWGLADEVKAGDSLNAFVYKDGQGYSDTYCWFDKTDVSAEGSAEISLVLKGAGYDANWNPIEVPLENAVITLNGEKTEFKTDKDGKVTVTVNNAGSYVISAVSEDAVLVPPVCKLTVTAKEVITDNKDNNQDKVTSPETGDSRNIAVLAIIMAVSLCGIIVSALKNKSYDE